jgi:hypothetical protein
MARAKTLRWKVIEIICLLAVTGAMSSGAQGQVVGPEIPIWIDSTPSMIPSVAYNSVHGEFLVVWYNEQGLNSHDIYALGSRPLPCSQWS